MQGIAQFAGLSSPIYPDNPFLLPSPPTKALTTRETSRVGGGGAWISHFA
jgi:hypothetical protein